MQNVEKAYGELKVGDVVSVDLNDGELLDTLVGEYLIPFAAFLKELTPFHLRHLIHYTCR